MFEPPLFVEIHKDLIVNAVEISSIHTVDAGAQINFKKGSFEVAGNMTVQDVWEMLAHIKITRGE